MTKTTALWLIIMHITGQYYDIEKIPVYDFLFIFIAPLIIFYIGIYHKKRRLKKTFTYTDGLKEGFKIAIVYALLSPCVYLFYFLINPEILTVIAKMYDIEGSSKITVMAIAFMAQFIISISGGTLYGAVISIFLLGNVRK